MKKTITFGLVLLLLLVPNASAMLSFFGNPLTLQGQAWGCSVYPVETYDFPSGGEIDIYGETSVFNLYRVNDQGGWDYLGEYVQRIFLNKPSYHYVVEEYDGCDFTEEEHYCIDSDGDNIFVKGKSTAYNSEYYDKEVVVYDECRGFDVLEHTCFDGYRLSTIHSCGTGYDCVDGACVEEYSDEWLSIVDADWCGVQEGEYWVCRERVTCESGEERFDEKDGCMNKFSYDMGIDSIEIPKEEVEKESLGEDAFDSQTIISDYTVDRTLLCDVLTGTFSERKDIELVYHKYKNNKYCQDRAFEVQSKTNANDSVSIGWFLAVVVVVGIWFLWKKFPGLVGAIKK